MERVASRLFSIRGTLTLSVSNCHSRLLSCSVVVELDLHHGVAPVVASVVEVKVAVETTVNMDETFTIAIGRVATAFWTGRSGDGAAKLVVFLRSSVKTIGVLDGARVRDDAVQGDKHVVRVDGHGGDGNAGELTVNLDTERGDLSAIVRCAGVVDLDILDIAVVVEQVTERFRVAIFGQSSQGIRGGLAKLKQLHLVVVDHDKEGRERLEVGQVRHSELDLVLAAPAAKPTGGLIVQSRLIQFLVEIGKAIGVFLDRDDLGKHIVGGVSVTNGLG